MENEIIPQNEMINENRIIRNHGITSNQFEKNNILSKEEKNRFIQEFIKEIFNKLECKGETFVIDRFEEDIAVCENRENR